MHTLDKLDSVTRDFWFGDHTVTSPEHLGVVPETTTDRWLNNQLSDPPYGVLESGEYLVTSSGSTGPVKLFPYRQDDWWKTLACTARGMLALGMDHDDVFLTTALGTMQAGFRVMEEAAQLVIGARVIIERSSSLKRKLERIRDHGVTVFMSTPSKLHRLADMEPRKYFTRQPRAIISTGGHITDKQRLMDAFGVDDIYDIYGSSEIGQIMWTCRHGHQHFNEDFTHMTYRDGRSFFTNIWTLPIFNNDLGDYISYSYKGRCECGSYLATVDEFRAKPRIAAK
jgi:phenylacetate-coenzyme A ligase PaaK-like adenylate-forming protein